jgi:D-3-phosphoglycerate dehydrogenase
MQVIAAAGRGPDTVPKPVPVLPLMEMLAAADVVSLHARLMPETQGMIDADAIAAMRRGASEHRAQGTGGWSRADRGAANRASGWRCFGQLRGRTASHRLTIAGPANVVLSPHVAGQTMGAVLRVGLTAAQAILDELAGRRRGFVVNPATYATRQRGI